MIDDDVYLYLNEGGFTPGMYERDEARANGSPAATKRSAWSWLPGMDRGRSAEREEPPKRASAEL